MLGVLVEKLYGKPYGVVLRDEIARPLGLTSLEYCGNVDRSREAAGYERADTGPSTPLAPVNESQALGSGGVCSTAADMAKSNHALHGGRVLSPALYAAMTTPRGAAIPAHYGFGLYVRPAPWGAPAVVHGGQTSGFTSENAWYPADSLSVTVLYNAYPRVPRGGTDIIGPLALGHTPKAAPPRHRWSSTVRCRLPTSSGSKRRQIRGRLRACARRRVQDHFRQRHILRHAPRGSRQPLVHESGATYAVGRNGSGSTATFLADADGQIVGILTRQDGKERTMRKIR